MAARPCLALFFVLVAASAAGAQERFAAADQNGDRKLDVTEFKVLIDSVAAGGQGMAIKVKRLQRYDTAFARLDANQDGFVSVSELAALQ
ncbi:EF-hand domain-containing protein [Aureimonas glaciei]|uniref:EF-hand domain-containing protein n=1 Tax=Aureimonas glaciei TaxID=1776957 RepID=A0A916Y5Z1_9HYPH|nr:EF-hand domain-containing protein [Aureimonas glaciei]GGD32298.1 hypothetical protein GCM10011335_39200 [Aureimonas glaciei]